MLLPALKGSSANILANSQMSIEDFIRNSTQNLQRLSAEVPGGGGQGALYLNFNGLSGAWSLNKEEVDPKAVGRILIPAYSLYEGMVEWAGGQPLQKVIRQLLGVKYDEPMSEKLFTKPPSPGAYRKDTDGPKFMCGFLGIMLDEGGKIAFEHSSGGGKKAIEALATTIVQAIVAFNEPVHPVITLGSNSYENSFRTIFNPHLNVVGFLTNARTQEAANITDRDIITRPMASKAKVTRQAAEAPAL
jgi:hypothetical protein